MQKIDLDFEEDNIAFLLYREFTKKGLLGKSAVLGVNAHVFIIDAVKMDKLGRYLFSVREPSTGFSGLVTSRGISKALEGMPIEALQLWWVR